MKEPGPATGAGHLGSATRITKLPGTIAGLGCGSSGVGAGVSPSPHEPSATHSSETCPAHAQERSWPPRPMPLTFLGRLFMRNQSSNNQGNHSLYGAS